MGGKPDPRCVDADPFGAHNSAIPQEGLQRDQADAQGAVRAAAGELSRLNGVAVEYGVEKAPSLVNLGRHEEAHERLTHDVGC